MTSLKKEKYVTDKKGKKTAVILDIKLYRRLLEDLEDLGIFAERKEEPTSSMEEVEERLKVRGKL